MPHLYLYHQISPVGTYGVNSMMRGVGGWRVRSVEWKGGTWYGIDGDVVGDGRHGVLVLVFGFASISL